MLVVVAMLAVGCSTTSGTVGSDLAPASPPPATSPTVPSLTAATPPAVAAALLPVRMSLLEGDGGVYGVGMPIIAYFDRSPTERTSFARATTVTVDGHPAAGAWYWETSAHPGAVVEAHYRLAEYWPAHARIELTAPIKGLSAGAGLAYADNVSLSMATGAAHVSTVDNTTHQMTVSSDGVVLKTVPVSLGAGDHPTFKGVKVVMERDRVEEMKSTPGEPYYDVMVPWSLRLTNSGEFAHDASWNHNIGDVNTSHGCTNLRPGDAQWFYEFSQIGDVLTYPNATGTTMPTWDGYGDWNVPWPVWSAGGVTG